MKAKMGWFWFGTSALAGFLATRVVTAQAAERRVPAAACQAEYAWPDSRLASGSIVNYVTTNSFTQHVYCPIEDSTSFPRANVQTIVAHNHDVSSTGMNSATACIYDPYGTGASCGVTGYSFGTGTYNQTPSASGTGYTTINVDPGSIRLTSGNYWYWGATLEVSLHTAPGSPPYPAFSQFWMGT